MVNSKLFLAAIAFGPVAAGPCRPSPSKMLSSTIDFSSSSTVSISESSLPSGTTFDASTTKKSSPEATTDPATETSLISITATIESTTAIPTVSTESQGTMADTTSDISTENTVEGKSTIETTPTNEITSTTLESTTEGSGSASTATVTTGTAITEQTTTTAESTLESESSSVQATATTEEITTTTEATTTTTAAGSTTTAEATTTTISMEPVSTTFNLLVQGGLMADGAALRSNGQDALIGNSQATAPWFTSYLTAPLSYDPITQHLLLGNKRLCLMYDSSVVASFALCQGPPAGQYFELTCDDPSAGSLICNVPAKQYISKDNIFVDTGDTWNQFYLLEINRQFSPGIFRIIIAKDNLSTNDIKYAAFERITVGTRAV
ncbi:hypothetical protein FSPOR_4123 [Fusarium sporotrichioides]|uniref:Uncharacterized protein n=1 Tax=Fusarium sporotrichioides TaxID=5514 RepID=A0A395SCZ2_FUSSP|nr:hypothetical protein FSPOR_4123 [Fusarium sporotrichioides]